jgi:hypothetical protein
LLGEGEDVAEEVDVVIGGEQGDQAEDQADQGLEDPGSIHPKQGGVQIGQVWRKLRWVGVAGDWGAGRWRHGEGSSRRGGHNGSLCFCATTCRNTRGGGDALARPASGLACCNGLRCGEITHALASRRVR